MMYVHPLKYSPTKYLLVQIPTLLNTHKFNPQQLNPHPLKPTHSIPTYSTPTSVGSRIFHWGRGRQPQCGVLTSDTGTFQCRYVKTVEGTPGSANATLFRIHQLNTHPLVNPHPLRYPTFSNPTFQSLLINSPPCQHPPSQICTHSIPTLSNHYPLNIISWVGVIFLKERPACRIQ